MKQVESGVNLRHDVRIALEKHCEAWHFSFKAVTVNKGIGINPKSPRKILF